MNREESEVLLQGYCELARKASELALLTAIYLPPGSPAIFEARLLCQQMGESVAKVLTNDHPAQDAFLKWAELYSRYAEPNHP